MLIIGFTGLAQSGKSTASSYLENNFDFIKVNFKAAIIDEIKSTFPDFLNKEAEIHKCSIDNLFATKPGSFRQFLQNYGTDLRRKSDNDYWVNMWMAKANNTFIATNKNIVVDDVRFLNEAKAIKKFGGIIIRVIKEGQEIESDHPSEVEMGDISVDYTITAKEGNIEGLCFDLKRIYGSIEQ